MTSPLRPDEIQRESEIRKSRGRTNEVRSGLKMAATLGAGAIAPGIAAKVLPFLSEYIPADLALKGINKVMPGLGNFLKNGMNQGLSLESGLSFLKENFANQKPEQSEPPKENRNIIEQYSPELHQFIVQQVAGGRKPIEAAAIAQNDKRFSSIINKLSKDHNTPWSSIIESVYGTGQYGGAMNSPNQQQQPPQAAANQQAPNPQQGQPGPGQQALMQILNKINQKLGQ